MLYEKKHGSMGQKSPKTPTLANKTDPDNKITLEESKLLALTDEKRLIAGKKPESSAAMFNLTTAGQTDFHESSQKSE